MKTKQQLQNEAMARLGELDKALTDVPAVPYEQCGPDGKDAWNKFAEALQAYRTAIALWKVAE